MVSNKAINKYKLFWLSWVVISEALFGCHDILILGKSPIKWEQVPAWHLLLTGTLRTNTNKNSIDGAFISRRKMMLHFNLTHSKTLRDVTKRNVMYVINGTVV